MRWHAQQSTHFRLARLSSCITADPGSSPAIGRAPASLVPNSNGEAHRLEFQRSDNHHLTTTPCGLNTSHWTAPRVPEEIYSTTLSPACRRQTSYSFPSPGLTNDCFVRPNGKIPLFDISSLVSACTIIASTCFSRTIGIAHVASDTPRHCCSMTVRSLSSGSIFTRVSAMTYRLLVRFRPVHARGSQTGQNIS